MDRTTTRIRLVRRPDGEPVDADFETDTVELRAPRSGEVVLRNIYLSLDPYVRGRMSLTPSYMPPMELGDVVVGETVSEVVESRAEGFVPGDHVVSYAGWQTATVTPARHLTKIESDLPLSTALGVLGMPGFTAYAGLLQIGRPAPGETVVVAAATGAVGSVVGQVARARGARAVGIAGGERKRAALLEEFGFDVALDHRTPDFAEELIRATPDGVDVYFENVGGPVTDLVVPRLNTHARIPVCGLISEYNENSDAGTDRLAAFMWTVLRKSLTVRGFIQTEFIADHHADFRTDMQAWVADGTVRYREDIIDGLANAPEAFRGLLRGDNFGKLLIRIAPETTVSPTDDAHRPSAQLSGRPHS